MRRLQGASAASESLTNQIESLLRRQEVNGGGSSEKIVEKIIKKNIKQAQNGFERLLFVCQIFDGPYKHLILGMYASRLQQQKQGEQQQNQLNSPTQACNWNTHKRQLLCLYMCVCAPYASCGPPNIARTLSSAAALPLLLLLLLLNPYSNKQ